MWLTKSMNNTASPRSDTMTKTYAAFGMVGKTARASRYVLVTHRNAHPGHPDAGCPPIKAALVILKGSDSLATIQKARRSDKLSRFSTVIVDLG